MSTNSSFATHSGHGDEGPPVGVHHGGEAGIVGVLFEDVGQGGEDEHAHGHEEHQEAQLLVGVLQREAQALQAHAVASQFEYPVGKKAICNFK